MNRPSKLAIAAILASISFSSMSHADSVPADWQSQLEKIVGTFHADFDVEFSNEFNREDYQNNPYASPLRGDGVAKLQAAIRRNKSLSERLEATGIRINTIVNAAPAGDGSLTFFARKDME
ncbi:hypothetical protein [Aliirhizobium cellulosilyticum]|uniref:Nuclear transport factor 2 family protein n=1 Tax=Aliirhizobium cellulosilyticum TaxID=393664 RepID=A0A7W6SAI9_9HYPH|nr:hypothetical protein [Rhizobium cellulosilyticum]MBB4349377.1 hypothetical protein [Rhizobium cellulosilyticum]MBB4412401.1 hypothetical protein [Rhizobium cellulosilyticum]MBB4447033.1 hypothetical protein [Rhizobium cellulosilyticum]